MQQLQEYLMNKFQTWQPHAPEVVERTKRSVTLKWLEDEPFGFMRNHLLYRIQRKEKIPPWVTVYSGGKTTKTIDDLAPSHPHKFRLQVILKSTAVSSLSDEAIKHYGDENTIRFSMDNATRTEATTSKVDCVVSKQTSETSVNKSDKTLQEVLEIPKEKLETSTDAQEIPEQFISGNKKGFIEKETNNTVITTKATPANSGQNKKSRQTSRRTSRWNVVNVAHGSISNDKALLTCSRPNMKVVIPLDNWLSNTATETCHKHFTVVSRTRVLASRMSPKTLPASMSTVGIMPGGTEPRNLQKKGTNAIASSVVQQGVPRAGEVGLSSRSKSLDSTHAWLESQWSEETWTSTDTDGTSAMCFCMGVRCGYFKQVQVMLEERPILIGAINSISGLTPLASAVKKGDLNAVKFVLSLGAEVDQPTTASQTPLQLAVLAGHVAVADVLLERGANFQAQDLNGLHVEHFAVDSCKLEMVKYIMDKGGDVGVTDSNGWTPLFRAVCQGAKTEVIEELMNRGSGVDVTDRRGLTLVAAARLLRNRQDRSRDSVLRLVDAQFPHDKALAMFTRLTKKIYSVHTLLK